MSKIKNRQYTEENFQNDLEVKEYIRKQKEEYMKAKENTWAINEDKNFDLIKTLAGVISLLIFIVVLVWLFWWFDYMRCVQYVNSQCFYWYDKKICGVNCDFKTVMTKSWEEIK